MHIEFKKLVLHNFISFGHSELEFGDDGFVKVSGVNLNPDDSATSNGSGKSSIWEGLVWALTGDTIRGTKQVANIYGEDGTYVELEFNIDSCRYRIIRSKDHKVYKTNLQIFVDGKDASGKGIRESESLLKMMLPDITASLLGSVIVLGQGLPQKFTNNSPSGRKEVLEKLSKSDFMIEDLKRRVTSRKQELHKDLRATEDLIVELQSKRCVFDEQNRKNQQLLTSMDKAQLEVDVGLHAEKITELQSAILTLENQLQQEEQPKLESIQTQLRAALEDKNDHVQEVLDFYKPHIDRETQTVSELSAKVNVEVQELKKLESITDTCPTCGQKLIGVEKPDTSQLRTQLDTDRVLLELAKKHITDTRNEQDCKIAEYEHSCREWTAALETQLKETKTLVSALQRDISNCRTQLQTQESAYREISEKLTKIETTIKTLEENIATNTREIESIDAALMYNNSVKETQQAHAEVINKFDTALKRDFRGYLLSTIIEYISKRTKEYCQVIFETDKIEFALNGNNIDISYMNKAYENLSGGEKQKIDLIVQFSIRDMLCSHLGFTSNILVLDEVFDGLDMIGCQRVLDVISAISDIKNIFIVTHRKDLSIPCDKELTVVKDSNGFSEITW